MIGTELVSVIIPVYNVKVYLDNCISSVCNQTYENIEIIVVDDGSTDGSSQICDYWGMQDNRIKVIHKENGGLSSARNEGLKHATGKYISFVDGDDSVDNTLFECTIPYMDRGMEMVAFGFKLTYKDKKAQEIVFPAKEYLLNNEQEMVDFIIGPFFRHELGWNACNRIFLKEYIDRYDIEFVDTKRIFAEDQLFCLCYQVHCSKIKMVDNCLYNYFQREGSIMHKSNSAKNYHFAQINELSKVLNEYWNRWEKLQFLTNIFPIIHYLLIERAVQKKETDSFDINAISKCVREDVEQNSDIHFFDLQMNLFQKHAAILKKEYSYFSIIRKKSRVKELATGKSNLYRVIVRLSKLYRKCKNIYEKNINTGK